MKKLSFIMAVIMIVMTFPMMFMTSASAAGVVAADADAPETVTCYFTDSNALKEFASDEEAYLAGAIGRFTKEGGNGYATSWAVAGANARSATDGEGNKVSVFYLIADFVVDHSNNAIGRGTNALDIGGSGRYIVVDGSLGVAELGRNFKIYAKDNGAIRLIHYNAKANVGKITFRNVNFFTNDTGSALQMNSGYTADFAFENCTIETPQAGQMFCYRAEGDISFTNCVLKGRLDATSNGQYFMLLDQGGAMNLTMDNCTVEASRGFNFNTGTDKNIEINNCKFELNAPAGSGGFIQGADNNNIITGVKIVVNDTTINSVYAVVLRKNMNVTFNNCNITTAKTMFFAGDKGAAMVNASITVNGGVYTAKTEGILKSVGHKNTTFNFVDGVFVANNVKDEAVAKGNGETVGDKGMFYLSNCKELNIYGGSYTLYKDHGVTLCEKSPIILGWANGGVNTTVYGGKFTGGSCFFAKVKNDSNAKFDEAGSVFYGYGEGKNSINIAPEVVKGASIRLDAKSGLRFTSTIAANTINYLNAALVKAETELTYGTVITRASYLKYTGGVFTMEAFDKAGKNYVNVVAKDGVAKNADGSVTINAALVDIDAANYDKDFVAISYVKYTNANDEEVYLYATNVSLAENARNMEEVALAALADVKTKAEGAYTNAVSEYYVYNVAARKYELYTGTAYSAYTAEQVKALQSYIVVEE